MAYSGTIMLLNNGSDQCRESLAAHTVGPVVLITGYKGQKGDQMPTENRATHGSNDLWGGHHTTNVEGLQHYFIHTGASSDLIIHKLK